MDEYYVKIEASKENEAKEFGIIEVYPYLNYSCEEECLTEDLNDLFQISLNNRVSEVYILVRSQEAQKRLIDVLLGSGYDTAKEVSARDIVADTIGSCFREKELGEVLSDPKDRQYFSPENIWGKSSDTAISVKIKNRNLKEFKELIKSLRKTENFRNVWKEEGGLIIK